MRKTRVGKIRSEKYKSSLDKIFSKYKMGPVGGWNTLMYILIIYIYIYVCIYMCTHAYICLALFHSTYFLKIVLQLIYNVMLVSGAKHSDLDRQINFLFRIFFPYRLLPNIQYTSLGYTVSPCPLSVLLTNTLFNHLFIYFYFWLPWVFVATCWLSLIMASRGYLV